MVTFEVKKILKQGLLKIVIIPKKSKMEIGDYVKIDKLNLDYESGK